MAWRIATESITKHVNMPSKFYSLYKHMKKYKYQP